MANETPPALKPYEFHGVDFSVKPGASQAVGDCPFCGKEGKWFCASDSGKWDCKVCGLSGNVYGFLRELWAQSREATPESDFILLSQERRLLSPKTLEAWGVVRSLITNEWLVPGFGADGKLNQLYRYARHSPDAPLKLFATSEIQHQLHGPCTSKGLSFDKKRPEVYLCEGPWDGMALWETMLRARMVSVRTVRRAGETHPLESTGNPAVSLLVSANVLATPGANVFSPSWSSLFEGKTLYLCHDSDHPRALCKGCKKSYSTVTYDRCPNCGSGDVLSRPVPAGLAGIKRVVSLLARAATQPKQVKYLAWGRDTQHDLNKPDGHDVRDHLGGENDSV